MTNHHAGFDSIEQAGAWFDPRRWYGDKGRALADARSTFAAEATVDGSQVRVDVVELEFSAGSSSSYVLLRDPSRPEHDLIEDADVRAWLMTGFLESRVLAGTAGSLRWSTTGEPFAADAGTSRVFRGEQSNSSITYGDSVMVKLFRKVRPGENPEVEIGRHLTTNTDFRAFPKLLGTITLDTGQHATTIAAAQQFIPSQGDAWSWMVDGLADPAFADTAIEAANTLGRRTAQMHEALAIGADDAFVPELITADYAVAVYEESLREVEGTLAQLEANGVPGSRDLGEAIKQPLVDLRKLEGTYRIRIHGDYHLGQVLRTNDNDFAILDFEGEPSRPLEERRAKASPLRDVAGMLRSFDYAAETAHRRYPDLSSDGFASWRSAVRQAFADGYTTTVSDSGPLRDDLEPDRRHRLISAFEVHKALYEVRYELGNRPDWLDIPLGGLRRIVRASS